MGVAIYLQDENGQVIETIGDSHDDCLLKLLALTWEGDSYPLLRPIINQHDTNLSCLQMETFLSEVDRLYERAVTESDRLMLDDLKKLGEICRDEKLYLRIALD